MKEKELELEGTWEEIMSRAEEFAGRRVRVIVLPPEGPVTKAVDKNGHTPANSILKYAGKWEGDDLEERLDEVYQSRSQVES